MRRVFFLIVIIATSMSASIAGITVPDAVQNAFKQRFREVQNISWSQKNTDFTATFTMNGNQMMASFSNNGAWIETDTKYPVTSLPKGVTDGIKKEYPAAQILSADRMETATKGTYFLTKISNEGKQVELHVDLNGSILKS